MDKAILKTAIALRHELHAHPELSGVETWTKNRLMAFVREHTGLTVVDRGAWFYAVHASGVDAPGIAFRADFDAIAVDEGIDLPYGSAFPGVSHKCGHDGHSAVLCALAMEVDRRGAGRDVFFIFQHAEETGAGAKECAAALDGLNIAEIYGFHNMPGYPAGTVAMRKGTMNCASQGMAIHFTGTPAHASLPETGHNPALAVADIVRLIPELVAPGKNRGLVLCTVIQIDLGEPAFGVSASEGRLLLTCRGQYEAEMNALSAALRRRAEEFAARDGLRVAFAYHDVFPETVNDGAAVDRIAAVCAALGVPVQTMPEPMRSSEDIGHFFKRVSGALFLMGAGDRPPIHTSGYDFSDDIIEPTVEIFKGLVAL